MRSAVVIAILAMGAPTATLRAAGATYKFVGAPLVINNGECLTRKDKITLTLVFPKPIAEGACNTDSPTSLTISDGVNKATVKPAYFNQTSFDLCKLQHGNTVDTWEVGGLLLSKSQTPTFLIGLENAGGQVSDQVDDYICSPVASGSTGKPGKWTGP